MLVVWLAPPKKHPKSGSIKSRSVDCAGYGRCSTSIHVHQTILIPVLLNVFVHYHADSWAHLQGTMFKTVGAHVPPDYLTVTCPSSTVGNDIILLPKPSLFQPYSWIWAATVQVLSLFGDSPHCNSHVCGIDTSEVDSSENKICFTHCLQPKPSISDIVLLCWQLLCCAIALLILHSINKSRVGRN